MKEPFEIPLDVYVDPWNEEQGVLVHPDMPLLRLRPQVSLSNGGIRHLVERLVLAARREHERTKG